MAHGPGKPGSWDGRKSGFGRGPRAHACCPLWLKRVHLPPCRLQKPPASRKTDPDDGDDRHKANLVVVRWPSLTVGEGRPMKVGVAEPGRISRRTLVTVCGLGLAERNADGQLLEAYVVVRWLSLAVNEVRPMMVSGHQSLFPAAALRLPRPVGRTGVQGVRLLDYWCLVKFRGNERRSRDGSTTGAPG